MNRFAIVILSALAILTSCAVWDNVRPVVREVKDIAHDLCLAYEDRAKTPNLERICEEEKKLKPWIDLVATARESGPLEAIATEAPDSPAGELSASPAGLDTLPPAPPVSAAPSAR